MHNEETFRNLEASLAPLKQITDEQRAQILVAEHERDLLAAGHKAAVEMYVQLAIAKCDSVLSD